MKIILIIDKKIKEAIAHTFSLKISFKMMNNKLQRYNNFKTKVIKNFLEKEKKFKLSKFWKNKN